MLELSYAHTSSAVGSSVLPSTPRTHCTVGCGKQDNSKEFEMREREGKEVEEGTARTSNLTTYLLISNSLPTYPLQQPQSDKLCTLHSLGNHPNFSFRIPKYLHTRKI